MFLYYWIFNKSQEGNKSQHALLSNLCTENSADLAVNRQEVDLMYVVGLNYFAPQGDRGLPGPRGPRGQQGVGIKGDKVGCAYTLRYLY